jgi:biopolymer transport protein TolR
MKLTPLQKRAARKARNQSQLDLNLVSLIDVFTILIFFLLSSATEVETLPTTRAVKLPESTADKTPRETVVVVVSNDDILVQGRAVARVTDAMKLDGDLIEPLRAELALQSGRQVVRAENQAQSQAVTIMADKDIPYRLLRKIMVTSSQASFTDVSFAVRPKDAT